ncbi:MAG: DNA methyltransferase [candidate division Zixibacteria bacterium RBG_16_53_22]|nr:MAG: DNA methyltransferase [candidate division Zixibacteria bacterium RBG_16_53_22]
MTELESFTTKAKRLIKRVPKGKVATYGQIAALAGSPLGARQVVRILHSSSRKENLPWHRIINSSGRISLPPGGGYEEQKALLLGEGVLFDKADCIDLARFQWQPHAIEK